MHTRTHTTHEHMRSQIRHYAGSVCYTSTGFMDKNKDTLQMDLSKCMNTATNELIAKCYSGEIRVCVCVCVCVCTHACVQLPALLSSPSGVCIYVCVCVCVCARARS